MQTPTRLLTGLAAGVLLVALQANSADGVPLPKPRPGSTPVKADAKPTTTAATAAPRAARFAVASSEPISSADVAALDEAVAAARRGKTTQAADLAATISDPVARKLVEWAILRSDDADSVDINRYMAFINENPTWPAIGMLRRRAESTLWTDRRDPAFVRAFFGKDRPVTTKGKFALARALLLQGDRAGAQSLVRDAWRNDDFSGELEGLALDVFKDLISAADHKARMDMRLYAEDVEDGLRAANRAGGNAPAIAKARIAVIKKAANAKAMLDAVPAEAHRDVGYIFSSVQFLRRSDKPVEAAELILSVPADHGQAIDTNEWWIERRLAARKMLDLGEIQDRLSHRARRHGPDQGQLPRRAPVHRRLDRAALPQRPHDRVRPFRQDRPGQQQPDRARARRLLAGARGRSAGAKGRGARALRGGGALFHRLLRPDRAGTARPQGSRSASRRPSPRRIGAHSKSHARSSCSTPSTSAIWSRERSPISANGRTDTAALAAIGDVAARHKDARAMLLLGKAALGRGLPLEHYAFPTIGIPDYHAIGPAIEPAVVYAIARQESTFNPKIISSARAMGLMQVTPEAGRYVSKKFGQTYDEKRLLSDQTYNVQLGAAELGDLYADYRGSHILTFVGYNAGRGRVRDWIARYGDPRNPKVDPIDWVEQIPFSETRNYVQRVLENLQVYRVRFGGGSKLLIEADLRRGGAEN